MKPGRMIRVITPSIISSASRFQAQREQPRAPAASADPQLRQVDSDFVDIEQFLFASYFSFD
jgi:hypothetical protein